MIVVKRQAHLFEIVLTLATVGGFPNFLDCWQEQSNQHSNNGNDNTKFHEGEAIAMGYAHGDNAK
jgi:hypothetical protein